MRAREPIGRCDAGGWAGRFTNAARPAAWAVTSRLSIRADDWQREWPRLTEAMAGDTLAVLKRDASGDVLAGTVTLAGQRVDVVLKRPREKFRYRQITSLLRASRARRAWDRARLLRRSNVAVEPPLALFERRRGVSTESVAVYERVPGPTLEHVDLDAIEPAARARLFRRCGRLLRRMERRKLAHTDAKSSNWIVFDAGGSLGPVPVLIDVYGVRWLNPWLGLFGLHRLLRAMKKHPQYTPADSLAICQGFAPTAEFVREEGPADAD